MERIGHFVVHCIDITSYEAILCQIGAGVLGPIRDMDIHIPQLSTHHPTLRSTLR